MKASDSLTDMHFFYIFIHFPRYLAKFQYITNIRMHVFGLLSLRIYSRHQFSLFQVLVENWSLQKKIIFSKNTTQVENITKQLSTAICIKKTKKLWAIFVQLSILHCYNNSYNVIQCCIFDKIVSLIPIVIEDLEQGKYLGAVNTWR